MRKKARRWWSAARCLCGPYVSAFRKQAKRGRGTHAHTKKPSALFKPQAHVFITSTRIWKQRDSQHKPISISQLLMMRHRCTKQPDANAHTHGRLAPSRAGPALSQTGDSRLCFSRLLSCLGWFYVRSSHCKLDSPQSDAFAERNRLLFTFTARLNNVCRSCVVCFESDVPNLPFFTVISAGVIAKSKLLSPFNPIVCEIVKTIRRMRWIWNFRFKQICSRGDLELIVCGLRNF